MAKLAAVYLPRDSCHVSHIAVIILPKHCRRPLTVVEWNTAEAVGGWIKASASQGLAGPSEHQRSVLVNLRLLIAHHQEVIRLGLATLLEGTPIHVVAQAEGSKRNA